MLVWRRCIRKSDHVPTWAPEEAHVGWAWGSTFFWGFPRIHQDLIPSWAGAELTCCPMEEPAPFWAKGLSVAFPLMLYLLPAVHIWQHCLAYAPNSMLCMETCIQTELLPPLMGPRIPVVPLNPSLKHIVPTLISCSLPCCGLPWGFWGSQRPGVVCCFEESTVEVQECLGIPCGSKALR